MITLLRDVEICDLSKQKQNVPNEKSYLSTYLKRIIKGTRLGVIKFILTVLVLALEV